MNLCKYKDILDIPKKCVHSYRIFNIGIFIVYLLFPLALIALNNSKIFNISFLCVAVKT